MQRKIYNIERTRAYEDEERFLQMPYRRRLGYLTDKELEQEFNRVAQEVNKLLKKKERGKKHESKRINSHSVQFIDKQQVENTGKQN